MIWLNVRNKTVSSGSPPMVEMAQSTHTRLCRFRNGVTNVPWKPPFAENVEKCRVRCQRPLPDICQPTHSP